MNTGDTTDQATTDQATRDQGGSPIGDSPVPSGWDSDASTTVTASPAPLATFTPTERPDLSIVTVTFGLSPVQPRMWAGLGASSEELANAEAIVVDNLHPRWGHGGGDLVSICTSGVQLMQPDENLGFGAGNNLGVDRCRADIICLLNPDVIVSPGDLASLVEIARDHPGDIVAPVLMNDDGTIQEKGGRISRDGTTRPIRSGDHEPDYASAACWVMHRDRFVELGGFDPIFYPAYYEDVDFALRLNQVGGRTRIDPTTRLMHAWTRHHLRRAPDTRPQHRLLRERWADELAGRPALRKPRPSTGRSPTRRAPSTKST